MNWSAISKIWVPFLGIIFGILMMFLSGYIGQWVDFRSWYSFGAFMCQSIVMLTGFGSIALTCGYFIRKIVK